MSYDVDVGKHASFNYTWNLSQFFYDHIDGGIDAFDGLTGKDVANLIESAFSAIDRTYCAGPKQMRATYDASNGWGSTDGAILWLTRIYIACRNHPRAKVRVS